MTHLTCDWCESDKVTTSKEKVYWELPDGTRAVEIIETPSIYCETCHVSYQSEETVKQIEDQLFLVNTKNIAKAITYEELMNMPRLLKRNYFDFS